jgi:uncharacterized protein YbjT (DUF2867 family)
LSGSRFRGPAGHLSMNNNTSFVLVTGGTGTLGQHVVPRLRAAGRRVRVLSRHPADGEPGIEQVAVDLATGEGLAAALTGVHTVLHLAGSQKGDAAAAQRLVEAAKRAGVTHIVYISVVGADRVPVVSGVDRAMFGYFAEKRGAEVAIEGSGIPWTILRATQFHDLALLTAQMMAKLPVIPVPSGVRFQPIETDEVAERLVELALGDPAGLVPDLAGPHAYPMLDLLRSYLKAAKKKRLLLPIGAPGGAAKAIRAGANLDPDRAVGRRTWEDFLAERVGRP